MLICFSENSNMFLQPFEIDRKSLVADIVAKDYRTADVFRKYGIGYCCGGKWPIEMSCEMNGVDVDKLYSELKSVVRPNAISNQLNFKDFDTDFIIDYIVNVHHRFFKQTWSGTKLMWQEFINEHQKKYSYLQALIDSFEKLEEFLFASMQKEEEDIFPYIRHITHAHKNKKWDGELVLRAMQNSIEDILQNEHKTVAEMIMTIREVTNTYAPPEKACISHKVVLAKLKEFDDQFMQHLHIKKSVLYPRALVLEKELLSL